MPKKGKKKAQTTEGDPEVEIISKVEIIYEDTKCQSPKISEKFKILKIQIIFNNAVS